MTDKVWAQLALSVMDLTNLNDTDGDDKIRELCESASTFFGPVAAVCVYPDFIQTAQSTLARCDSKLVTVATVTNFPHGNADVASAVCETQKAVVLGADEVDVVFPYQALIQGDETIGFELVRECKSACGDIMLKVIIETGELKTPELIKKASEIAIAAGADFIKTSTGKVAVNATLESAEIMFNVIKSTNHEVGFKAAGGVRTLADAKAYLQLAEKVMGKDWVSSKTFRFGASGLLGNLLAVLNEETQNVDSQNY